MPLSAVGGARMSWGEAARLTVVLSGDPSSQVGAALAGWSYPVTREAMVLLSLFDLQHRVAAGGKRVPEYPRPWDVQPARLGAGTSLTVEEFRAMWDGDTGGGGSRV